MSYYNAEDEILKGGVFITQINDMYRVSLVPNAKLNGVPHSDEKGRNEEKTEASICRAKNTIIELAYCNDWDFFFTATFDKTKVANRADRKETLSKLIKWLQNKSRTQDIKYMLIPELHKDGESFHAHGLLKFGKPPNIERFSEIKDRPIPENLRRSDYWNWRDYERKFGFCSLGQIESKKAVAFYMSKYITKGLQNAITDFGAHIYYASKGLSRGESVGGFHNSNKQIDLMKAIPWDYKDEQKGTATMTIHSAEELNELLNRCGLKLFHAKNIK
jgi:hypothetical protein